MAIGIGLVTGVGIQHRLNRFPADILQSEITEGRNQVHAKKIRVRFLGSIFHRGQHYRFPIHPHKVDKLASCLGVEPGALENL